MRSSLFAVTLFSLVVAWTASAAAKTSGLKALAAPDDVSLDGLPNEFDGEWRKLPHVDAGAEPTSDDCSAEVLIAYDDDALWVVAEVIDDALVGGGDHVELLLGIPGGKLVSFELYPGVAGKSRASAKSRGIPIRGAEVVEAPNGAGYTLEAKIPWSAVPLSRTIRVGYRGAVFVHDADNGRKAETVIGTADSRRYGELPPISMAAELSLGSGLLRKRNIQSAPVQNLLANVVGDALLERVLVYERYLVILGPGYRDGAQYYFRDLGSNAAKGEMLAFDVKDVTGDGRKDIVLRRKVKGSEGTVEVMEILSYHPGGETPEAVFAQELKLDIGGGHVTNTAKLNGWGGKTRIVVDAGTTDGIDGTRFERISNTGANPVLPPWGAVAAQTYEFRGASFVVVDEKSQAPKVRSVAASSSGDSGSTTNKGCSWEMKKGADVGKVYAHYKKQRNVRGRARFDLTADVDEGRETERIVVHGSDLVVFGSGFKGGRGFAAVELASFEKAGDVKKVSTRDVTGDGKDEIVVRGLIRSPMPDDLGGGDMRREVVRIYKLAGGQFDRV
ncbi:MAG: hypothetical protein RIF41_26495, partial [Polyangiaceae bacterium]